MLRSRIRRSAPVCNVRAFQFCRHLRVHDEGAGEVDAGEVRVAQLPIPVIARLIEEGRDVAALHLPQDFLHSLDVLSLRAEEQVVAQRHVHQVWILRHLQDAEVRRNEDTSFLWVQGASDHLQ